MQVSRREMMVSAAALAAAGKTVPGVAQGAALSATAATPQWAWVYRLQPLLQYFNILFSTEALLLCSVPHAVRFTPTV